MNCKDIYWLNKIMKYYLNYFRFAYRKEELRKYEKKKSTKYRSPKSYK